MATVTYAFAHPHSFQANSFTHGNQALPRVLALAGGGYAFAYTVADPGTYPVVDFFTSAGSRIGTYRDPFGGAAGATTQFPAALTQLADGSVEVAYTADDPAYDIQARQYSRTGTVLGDVKPLTANGFANNDPELAALTGGRFVVVYNENGVDNYTTARIFESDGTPVGPKFFVSADFADLTQDHDVTAMKDGGFAVSFIQESDGIKLAFLDKGGNAKAVDAPLDGTPTPTTEPFVVVDGGAADPRTPVLATTASGNIAIAYVDGNLGGADAGNTGISLTIVRPDGSFVLNSFANHATHVNVPSATEESHPSIATLANGFIVVSWTVKQGPSSDVVMRVFDGNGNAVTPVATIGSTAYAEALSALSSAKGGTFVSAWEDSASDGSGGRIKADVFELVRTTIGSNTAETLTGDDIRDVMAGGAGKDRLLGFGEADSLNGGAGADRLFGGKGGDRLAGGSGRDTLKGGDGGDRLVGGKDADKLYAGSGKDKDVFAFTSKHDSGNGDKAKDWDHIFGFDAKGGKHDRHTDKIDLSPLDGDKHGKHDQPFRFVDHFSHAGGKEPDGEVTVHDAGKNVKVLVDVDGDTHADMAILVMHVHDLHRADFIL